MAQTLLFHGPAQTKAHSPELIFHIMKSRDQTSVFSYLCNSVCIVWPRRHYQCKRCPLQQLPMRLLQNHQDFFLLSHFCLLHFVRLYPSLTFVHRSRQLKSWGGQLKGLKLNNNIVCSFFYTRNQALMAWSYNLRCGGIMVQNRNKDDLLFAIVFDFMVYPNLKNSLIFFWGWGWFFLY